MKTTIKGKCPNCCPDGGAIFKPLWGEGKKQCHNCGFILPYRQIKPTGKPTRSQDLVVKRIVAAFGGVPSTKMIGRNLWLSLTNRDRNLWMGDSLYGTIGVSGKIDLTLQRVVGDKKIKDDFDIRNYLTTTKTTNNGDQNGKNEENSSGT